MTFYQGLAVTLLRIWAATILVWGVYSLLAWLWMGISAPSFTTEQNAEYFWSQAASNVLYFLTGAAVWVFAGSVGRRVAEIGAAPATIAVEPATLVTIGCFLVGLFLFAQYAPEAVVQTVTTFQKAAMAADEARSARPLSAYDWEAFAKAWIATGMAVLIAFRARDLGRLFAWLREAGLNKPEITE